VVESRPSAGSGGTGKRENRSLKIATTILTNTALEIFNTDQGSQFTSLAFTDLLKANGIRSSMDGKGCLRDNIFVERLWRTIKYEEVYLKAYVSVSQARASIRHYMSFYNSGRPHSRLDRKTPDQVYFNPLPLPRAA